MSDTKRRGGKVLVVAYAFPPGFVTFSLDDKGKTDRLVINQPNNDFWFYELELRRTK